MTLDLTTLEAVLRERLAGSLPGLDAQLRFMPTPPRTGWKPGEFPSDARIAAGLLLLYPGARGPSIPLTVRASGLKRHAGQISLPGGATDPGETLAQAALREANEEIGLEERFIDPIGYLDLYLTFSGFRILPLLARVDPDYRLTINPAEVDDAFEVPLAFLMHPGNHQRLKRDWKGVERQYYAMPFEQRYIWGVTAGILRNLYERIYAG
jgi:8-oxo-dGTP pyrophosphatase MutT (NUDIX family)